MRLRPFNIVKAPYSDINGITNIGLFLIIYLEDRDKDIHYPRNVMAMKLTSKPLFFNKYFYVLPQKFHTFLDKESWVQISRPHILDYDKCHFLGDIQKGHRMAIYRKYLEFIYETEQQMLDQIPVKNKEVNHYAK